MKVCKQPRAILSFCWSPLQYVSNSQLLAHIVFLFDPRFCFVFTDGLQAECDFDSLREKGLIVTKFHNFDIEQSLTGVADMSFKYNHINGLKALIEESKCFQSLDQLCQPWIQLLYDFDEDIVKDQTSTDWSWDYIHVCTCLKYITPLSANFSSSIHRSVSLGRHLSTAVSTP